MALEGEFSVFASVHKWIRLYIWELKYLGEQFFGRNFFSDFFVFFMFGGNGVCSELVEYGSKGQALSEGGMCRRNTVCNVL